MAEYNGKNETKSLKYLFQERSRYYGNAYENADGTRKAGIADINSFETVFYGRVDKGMNSVFPKQSSIKYGSSMSVRGVNFAVDAMEGFLADYKQSLSAGGGQIAFNEQHPFLSNIKVYRSYEPPEVMYQRYIGNLMGQMLEQIIQNKDSNSIPDFPSYVNYFLSFLQNKGSNTPFTQTAWQKSTHSNIFTSGLAFSIANLDCGNDQVKSEFFKEDSNFLLYRQVAMNHGFSISLICPWIMIANPDDAENDSSRMRDYLINNNIINYNSIYKLLYNQLYHTDILELKNQLRLNYNQFVSRFPILKNLYFGKTKTTQTNQIRQQISVDEVNNHYSDLQFHLLYAKIRNIEEDLTFDAAEFARLEKNATFFYKKLDNFRALSYINNEYRTSYYQKPGGLNDYLNKQNTIEEIDSED